VRQINTEGLKGVAILLVILWHSVGVLNLPFNMHGDEGVDIFLMLSGFGLTLSMYDESFLSFFKRRLLKLVPSYWLSLLIVVFLSHFLAKDTVHGIKDILYHVLFLHIFSPKYLFSINMSWWFMGIIFPLYALFYLLKPLIKKGLSGLIFIIGISLTLIGIALVYHYSPIPAQNVYYQYCLPRIISFFIGIVAGIYWKGTNKGGINLFLLSLSVLFYFYFSVLFDTAFLTYPIYGLIVAGGAYFLIKSSPLLNNFFHWLGYYSYEIYLLHQPFIWYYNLYFVNKFFGKPENHKLLVLIGILIGFLLSTLLAIAIKKRKIIFF
jgi:peptidoglycan/LPS O-acetylase OafA/YrhL